MGYTRGLDHPRAFQLNWLGAQVVEQSDTTTEQDGHQVDMDFVKQSGLEALLGDAGGAYRDTLVPCNLPGLLNGAFYAVGDESERRSFLDPFLRNGMGNHDDWYVHRVSAMPRIGDVKCPASCHQSPDCIGGFFEKPGAGRADFEDHLTARHYKIGVAAGVPLKEPLSAIAHRSFRTIIRSGNKAIQRHRHI
jgi:hypothetical protein